MQRPFLGLLWAGVILFGVGFVLFQDLAMGAISLACLALLTVHYVRRRVLDTALPRPLKRLAYRATESEIAWAWRWRRGGDNRLRILRSERRPARSADEAERRVGGQVRIYDGPGESVIDRSVGARTLYHYSLFARRGNGWTAPVHQSVAALSAADREYLASTETAPAWREGRDPVTTDLRSAATGDPLALTIVSDPVSDRHGVDVQRAQMLGDAGVLSIVSEAVSGLIVDAAFDAAELFRGHPEDEGWCEIR